MRHNIFDSIPSNIVSGKDNVFANFLQTAGLYKSMKIDEDNIEDLILLLDGKVRISAYCKECKEERAEFTWKYYAGFYTKDNLPAEATRTWVTKTIAETDSDGTTHYITKLADAYKVSGDSLYMQAGDKSEQIKGLYLTQITEDGDLAVLSGSNQFSVRDVFLQNEDGTQSTQIKKRIYDLKCSLHGGIIPVSVPPEVSLREFPYNAVVELVNPVADTVSRKTYTGADVDWYVKAEDIVLKNKGNQNAGSPQSPTPQG